MVIIVEGRTTGQEDGRTQAGGGRTELRGEEVGRMTFYLLY